MIMPALAVVLLVSVPWAQTGASAPGQPQSDGEVAAFIKAANDAEIAAARLALERSQADDVRAFAERMIDEHQRSNQELASFVPGAGTTTGPASQLATEAGQQMQQLAGLSGNAFDSAYVADQVQDHAELLDALDHALGSTSGRAPSFQELLRGTRGMAAGHLTNARELQTQLRGR